MIDFEALFKVSYGLYIVSSGDDSIQNGFISNSVFQVTAEPPQFAACCNKDNYTAELIKKFSAFSISVLSKDTNIKLIGTFGYKSGRKTDKFSNIKYRKGINGIPVVIEESVAAIECRLVSTFDVGTHLIFIGEVTSAEIINPESEPLTYDYYRVVKKGVAPKNAPTYIDKNKLKKIEKTEKMQKYQCPECGYIYDPELGDPDSGIKPGTPFEDLPNDWICPVCDTKKEEFVKISD